jgi:hypothetical protein
VVQSVRVAAAAAGERPRHQPDLAHICQRYGAFQALYDERPDLRLEFPGLTGGDAERYLEWASVHGAAEASIQFLRGSSLNRRRRRNSQPDLPPAPNGCRLHKLEPAPCDVSSSCSKAYSPFLWRALAALRTRSGPGWSRGPGAPFALRHIAPELTPIVVLRAWQALNRAVAPTDDH